MVFGDNLSILFTTPPPMKAEAVGSGTHIHEAHHEKICFCICENKGTDQLRGDPAVDQGLCFHFMDRVVRSLFKPLL